MNTRRTNKSVIVGLMALSLLWTISAAAQVPGLWTYEGYLTEDGVALNDTVTVVVELFDADAEGVRSFLELHEDVDVVEGEFSLLLGSINPDGNPLNDSVLTGELMYLQLTVDGDVLEPRVPLGTVPYAARARRAENRTGVYVGENQVVDGSGNWVGNDIPQDDLDLTALLATISDLEDRIEELEGSSSASAIETLEGHVDDIQSELGITDGSRENSRIDQIMVEIGSFGSSRIDQIISELGGVGEDSRVDQLSTEVTSLADTRVTALETEVGTPLTESRIDDLVTRMGAAELDIAQAEGAASALTGRVEDVEEVTDPLSITGDQLYLTGVNLHIRSGHATGTTYHAADALTTGTPGDVNGLGNLIVGYDEADDREAGITGSHNVVIGPGHNVSSFGGLIGGRHNTVSNVSGLAAGYENTVSGIYSGVTGGRNNTASGEASSVSGGGDDAAEDGNTASGPYSSVLGGRGNIAAGERTTVAGGRENQSLGDEGSVLGGFGNLAGELDDGTGGDQGNQTRYSSIAGGYQNKTLARGAVVSGGNNNEASAAFAAVCGGSNNAASGESSSVTAGRNNTASGDFSSVSGGGGSTVEDANEASGSYSSVTGGSSNTAIGAYCAVVGGEGNHSGSSGGTFGLESHAVAVGGEGGGAVGSYSIKVGGEDTFAFGDHQIAP